MEEFEHWWSQYPNKQGRADALKKFKTFSDSDVQNLITATRHYEKAISSGVNCGKFVIGSTFINGRYLDWIKKPDDQMLAAANTESQSNESAADRFIRQNLKPEGGLNVARLN